MDSKLKALGLGLLVVFAILGASASAASAEAEFRSENGEEVVPTTAALTLMTFKFTPEAAEEISCKKLSFKEIYLDKKASYSAEPFYEECKLKKEGKEIEVFFNTNGCKYQFTAATAETEVTAGEYAKVHLTCPAGKQIEITAGALKQQCVDIPEQTLDGIYYENGVLEKQYFEIKFNAIHNLKTTTTNSETCPTKSGKTETHETGTMNGTLRFNGHNLNKVAINVWYEP